MIVKRITAAFLDIIISILPIIIIDSFLEFEIHSVLYKSYVLYIIHTSTYLLIMQMTLGERLLGIKLITLNTDNIKISKLILRNVVFSFFLLIIITSTYYTFEFIITVLLMIGINIFIFFKNDHGYPMTLVDFIFKTYYKECLK